ncbi:MAG: hypothetical protein KKC55_16390 [Gammaproteobacteria bacterium]|nr:hypothetical protein [Gammaproteobacteria bacterium]
MNEEEMQELARKILKSNYIVHIEKSPSWAVKHLELLQDTKLLCEAVLRKGAGEKE